MSVLLKDGSTVEDPRLDRLVTPTTTHLERYPLTMETLPTKPTAMVAGMNWYTGLDKPTRRRVRGVTRHVIGDGDLGRLRGGHAVCLRHWGLRDIVSWWVYYNQGKEGRCVEFAWLRERTLSERVRFDITSRWHYREMQRNDYWDGESPAYEGTSVDAGAKIMRRSGPIPTRWPYPELDVETAGTKADHSRGIEAYRWARDWDTVRAALGVPDYLPGVPLLNSWGRSYPKEVLLLDAAGERLLREQGEFAIVTDR